MACVIVAAEAFAGQAMQGPMIHTFEAEGSTIPSLRLLSRALMPTGRVSEASRISAWYPAVVGVALSALASAKPADPVT